MKILIVDDAKPVRIICARELKKYRVEITEAADGEEAYEKILAESPDLVLLDNDMPKLTGTELLDRLFEEHRKVNVVMVTARNEDRMLDNAFRKGALHYLIKPFTGEYLVEIINISLERVGLDPLEKLA